MRDFSCFGDGAVSLAASAAAAGAGAALDRSLQAATATVYKAALSSRKEILVRVMWTRTVAGAAPGGATGLAVAVDEASRSSPSPAAGSASAATPRRSAVALASSPQFLHKKRGTRSFVTEAGTVVAIYWDTTDAKYPAAGSSSPEPTRDYYLAVVADGELAVLLGGGEAARELARRFAAAPRRALLSRREQLRAAPASPAAMAAAAVAHSTRCRFRADGAEHEVAVVCRGEEWGTRDGEVAVSIDGKKVVEARRVKWNFRGNRTAVLGDGAVVEVMWDVHDWWFAGGGGGGAQFMVKARDGDGDGDGGRVWMDEAASIADDIPPSLTRITHPGPMITFTNHEVSILHYIPEPQDINEPLISNKQRYIVTALSVNRFRPPGEYELHLYHSHTQQWTTTHFNLGATVPPLLGLSYFDHRTTNVINLTHQSPGLMKTETAWDVAGILKQKEVRNSLFDKCGAATANEARVIPYQDYDPSVILSYVVLVCVRDDLNELSSDIFLSYLCGTLVLSLC
uniref:DUF1618 domain-containing protein n=1 Tax=Oryza meridionalis TaxID=40149 RepID=A0A0E0C6U3_9ORYZ